LPTQPVEGCNTATCAYWDETAAAWSSAGCSVVAQDQSGVKCSCSNLAEFAILASPASCTGAAGVQGGYTFAFAAFGAAAVASTALGAFAFVRKSSDQGAIYALVALSFVARMVVAFALTNAASMNTTAVNVISIVPFVIAYFWNIRLFERSRNETAPASPFKFSPVFNAAYLLFGAAALGLLAISASDNSNVSDSIIRVIAAISVALSLAFFVAAVHARQRLTVVASLASLCAAIAWVSFLNGGTAVAAWVVTDVFWGGALVVLQRSVSKPAPALPAKSSAEVPVATA